MKRPFVEVLFVVFAAVAIAVAGMGSAAGSGQEAVKGGVLRIAQKGEPATLDITFTQTDLDYWVALQIFETLLAFNGQGEPVPHLARTYWTTGDGLTHMFELRKGVRFHNGKEMTSDDVVASLRRWLQVSAVGKSIVGPRTVEVVAKAPYVVEWRLREPIGVLPYAMAMVRQAAAIVPAEVALSTGQARMTEIIGTGPFRLVEWKKGSMIRLARFERYQILPRPADGMAGHREAYVGGLEYTFVPESSVRMLGVEAGDYDFANEADREAYTRYRFSRKVQSFLGKAGMSWFAPNHAGPVLSNRKIRQAIQAAICVDPILGVYRHARFYKQVPAVMGAGPWATDAGREFYNQCNAQKARQLLAEAGYDGRPVRLVVRTGDPAKADIALVMQQQLAQVGLNLEIMVRDPAAYARITQDPSAYDGQINESPFIEHPVLLAHLPATGLSRWKNEEKERLVNELLAATSQARGLEIWKRIERLWYEDVTTVKFGNFYGYDIARAEVQGYSDRVLPYLWNVWIRRR